MDIPICELCGEDHATVMLAEAGACDDCASQAIKRAIAPALGRDICARILRHSNGELALCLATYGTEHDHQAFWLPPAA